MKQVATGALLALCLLLYACDEPSMLAPVSEDAEAESKTTVVAGKKPGPEPTWAYVVGNKGQIELLSFDGTEAKKLTKGASGISPRGYPHFSPDGGSIAYSQTIEWGYVWNELHVMDRDGKNDRTVYTFDEFSDGPIGPEFMDWLPDGTGLLYSANDLYVIRINEPDPMPVALGMSAVHPPYADILFGSVGPDLDPAPGFQGPIVYQRRAEAPYDKEIFVIRINEDAGGNLIPDPSTLVQLYRVGDESWPVFSPVPTGPGGEYTVAFTEAGAFTEGVAMLAITFDVGSWSFVGEPRVLRQGPTWQGPTWSPNGRCLAYVEFAHTAPRRSHLRRLHIGLDGSVTEFDIADGKPSDNRIFPNWDPTWVGQAGDELDCYL